MRQHTVTLLPAIAHKVGMLNPTTIPTSRKELLDQIAEYIQSKVSAGEPVNLQFICTHNARRSHLAQVWAKVAAVSSGVRIKSFSGGTEVTAFNHRAVETLQRAGFEISKSGEENPVYTVAFANDCRTLSCFSKRFDDPENQAASFAAVMVCSEADQQCPHIPGAEKRFKLPYEDPKASDDTPEEADRYDQRSTQIATEMFYLFSKIQKKA